MDQGTNIRARSDCRRKVDLGWQCMQLVIAAIHEVLDGYSRLRTYEREHGLPAFRHRIEHVQTIHPDDASRLAELNIVASMQANPCYFRYAYGGPVPWRTRRNILMPGILRCTMERGWLLDRMLRSKVRIRFGAYMLQLPGDAGMGLQGIKAGFPNRG